MIPTKAECLHHIMRNVWGCSDTEHDQDVVQYAVNLAGRDHEDALAVAMAYDPGCRIQPHARHALGDDWDAVTFSDGSIAYMHQHGIYQTDPGASA